MGDLVLKCGYTGSGCQEQVSLRHLPAHEQVHTTIILTKIAAAQNEVAPSYHRARGLYCLVVIYAATLG